VDDGDGTYPAHFLTGTDVLCAPVDQLVRRESLPVRIQYARCTFRITLRVVSRVEEVERVAGQEELFAAVDALLEQAGAELPPPAERARLRRAAGLSQQQVAAALQLKRRETVADWESGRSEPRPPQRAAYLRLLEGLAARYPAPEAAEPTAPPPSPPSRATTNSATHGGT
jgi:DNA-binding transcriptional regulator YiaG